MEGDASCCDQPAHAHRSVSSKQHMVQDEEAEDSEDDDNKPAPEHLAGARFRGKAEDLNEGETVIMTLADRRILNEQGELDDDNDELENVLTVCARHRWPHPLQPCIAAPCMLS